MLRRACLDAQGTMHHVRGIEKDHIVDDNEDRKLFVQQPGIVSGGYRGQVLTGAHPQMANLPDIGVARKI